MKKAFELAQQEVQEKEVSHLKEIVQKLLQQKKDKENEKEELNQEIRAIKKTIDDFKEGRLDKVKELIEKDTTAKRVVPLQITIINNQNRPSQPWKWIYGVEWVYPQQPYRFPINSVLTTTGDNILGNASNTVYYCNASGSNIATFTQGTYELDNGKTINL